ncbi:Pkinase-domain-containing protein [Basidiobolus meristosporus CBS 931.73]|uniref:non-specific serine/threonine protein kinase n=1 Tax=Basidiobolus meristosporus CBS 931.73 TaxID=1314790 RepID=A0A1Y1XBD2_9FUNG|nr:Pkinase-domain-containing protein [Basidiobolus meristosporus CBS 931.73]|eukprot:ORX82674.1 Pkinase-domain-containing protein [Basidiobolus meristosporus CBS 931.73]
MSPPTMYYNEAPVSSSRDVRSRHMSVPASMMAPMNFPGQSQFKHHRRPGPMFGPYVVLQTLGEGEFAKVKLGIHAQSGQEVAIKLIKKANVDSESRMAKIKREITVLRSLDHPNIVRLFEVIETDKYIGIIIEYASGGELFDHILAHRYLKEREACRLFAQLISGVSYMHEKNVVHRDLKLENLLLDRNRNIIITDFGFANQFSSPTNDLMATSCGSPCYAAPELVVSEGMYVGTAVDIWSCGVILYAMLCGYLPFDDDPENPDGDNINLLYKYILSTPLVFPDYVSPDARDLLRRMLVPDPTQRCDMKTIMEHNWLAPYAHIFEEGKSKSKSKNKGGSEGAEQANAEPDSPTFAETARPPKRHTIQVEYDQSPVPNLPSPEPQENHLNDIIEADEDEMNDSVPTEPASGKPSQAPSKAATPLSGTPLTGTPSSSMRKPKSHGRIRPTTIHFSQPTPQMQTDLPSVILTREESRGQFIDPNANELSHPEACDDEEKTTITSQTLAALDISTPKLDELTARAEKRKVVKSAFPSTLIGNFDNADSSVKQKSMSSNAARKVMDWFRKKSLGKPHGTHYYDSLPTPGRRSNIRASQEYKLRIHSGAIDQNAVTSRAPIEVFQDIKQVLFAMGIEIKKETDLKLKCTRRKRKTRNGSVATMKSTISHISTDTQTTANTNTTGQTSYTNNTYAFSPTSGYSSGSHAARRRTVSAFSRLLKLGTHHEDYSYPSEFMVPSSSSYGTPPIQPEPIYGDETVDPGDEISFVIEICRVKDFGNLYIVDIRRRKGNLWSYKFLYHTILDRLDLSSNEFNNGNTPLPSDTPASNHHIITA